MSNEQPLVERVDLRTPEGVVAILYTIRQAGKITYPALYEQIFGQAIDQSERNFRTTKLSMQQIFAFHNALLELYRNKFIEPTKPIETDDVLRVFQSVNPATEGGAIELQVSSTLPYMQYLFNVSLSQIVERGRPLQVFPAFGDPIAFDDKRWGDVFVIMPFREDLKNVYDDAIKPAVETSNMTARRGDDFYSDERIMDEVWTAVYRCKLCIADCTGANANVFYELGIAHTLGKASILITSSLDDIPFDVRDRRIIPYTNTEEGLIALRETLEKTIASEMIEHYGEDEGE